MLEFVLWVSFCSINIKMSSWRNSSADSNLKPCESTHVFYFFGMINLIPKQYWCSNELQGWVRIFAPCVNAITTQWNATSGLCSGCLGPVVKIWKQSPITLASSLRKTRQRNHVIIVTTTFSKSFVFNIFFVHTKTKSRRFQTSPDWRAFLRSFIVVTDKFEREALGFWISPG